MIPRQLIFALAALVPLAAQGNDVDGSIGAAVEPLINPVEEVVVDAPEPRYVAPTLRDRIGRVWAPVYINGKGPFRLVLDTGANRTAIIPALADRLGMPMESTPVKLLGATGSSMVPIIRVSSIEVGDLWLGDRKVAIVPDVFGGAEGVLGADGLSDKRVHIDFGNDQISILRSTGRMPQTLGTTRVPVKIQHGHLLMFDMKISGIRTKAMLDTGAQTTIGNRSLRTALSKRRQGIANEIIGVTLDVQKGETFFAPAVDIGGLTVRGMRVTFG
ncbi:MAG TPA: aspartyl protease family protein, partial [Candidatus Synoicihabitans sp.]|nr:aspartyl protease family protein [Candidatus Synoicihabitans sp.]